MKNELDTTERRRTSASASTAPDGHRWEHAGDAWGRRARDWACLFEHYAVDVVVAMFDRLAVRRGTELLDIACGSGLAIRMADGLGASVSGLDASEALIGIARERTPGADIRVGDMFDLPWADESFDTVTAINGVWGGCEAALAEAYRVLRPGGGIGISFWGDGHLDLKPCFRAFAQHSPPDHLAGMKRTNGIARPGVAEGMLESVGFELAGRDARVSTLEWLDDETAWRALSSIGPAVPALEHVGAEVLRPLVLDALRELCDSHGIYRFRNDHQFVVARKPA
ncbi:MAG: class I SAM-dependent methyltransferase [Acidimicrobiia bacterium]|nr:class I SAM-dependent methyltransferase [Acidimicrobiia bacterium]